jgi:hypothetical protein
VKATESDIVWRSSIHCPGASVDTTQLYTDALSASVNVFDDLHTVAVLDEVSLKVHNWERIVASKRLWKTVPLVLTCYTAVFWNLFQKSVENMRLVTGSRLQISARGPSVPTEVFCDFLNLSSQIPEEYHKLGHDRLLPQPFQFIIRW